MGLFKPAWQSENEEKALKAVEKKTLPLTLFEIAENAPLECVREAANKKFHSIISDYVKNIRYAEGYSSFIYKLSDQTVLADIALNGAYENVCTTAVDRLSDQNLIIEIVEKSKNERVRSFALNRITDLSVRKRIEYDIKEAKWKKEIEKEKRLGYDETYTVEKYVRDIKFYIGKKMWISGDQEGNYDISVTDDLYPTLVEIGRKAYKQGGIKMMKEINKEFHNYEGVALLRAWDGIEEWKKNK